MTANRVGSMFTFFSPASRLQMGERRDLRYREVRALPQRHAERRHLAAAVTVRSRIPQRGPHPAAHRADDRCGLRQALKQV